MNSTINIISSPITGNLISLAGLATSIVGFIITIIGVKKSKKAAEAAQDAAQKTKSNILKVDCVVECSNAISALDEIIRLIRANSFTIIQERFSAIKRSIITIKVSSSGLPDEDIITLQSSISQITTCIETIDRALKKNEIEKKSESIMQIASSISAILTEVLIKIRLNQE